MREMGPVRRRESKVASPPFFSMAFRTECNYGDRKTADHTHICFHYGLYYFSGSTKGGIVVRQLNEFITEIEIIISSNAPLSLPLPLYSLRALTWEVPSTHGPFLEGFSSLLIAVSKIIPSIPLHSHSMPNN